MEKKPRHNSTYIHNTPSVKNDDFAPVTWVCPCNSALLYVAAQQSLDYVRHVLSSLRILSTSNPICLVVRKSDPHPDLAIQRG